MAQDASSSYHTAHNINSMNSNDSSEHDHINTKTSRSDSDNNNNNSFTTTTQHSDTHNTLTKTSPLFSNGLTMDQHSTQYDDMDALTPQLAQKHVGPRNIGFPTYSYETMNPANATDDTFDHNDDDDRVHDQITISAGSNHDVDTIRASDDVDSIVLSSMSLDKVVQQLVNSTTGSKTNTRSNSELFMNHSRAGNNHHAIITEDRPPSVRASSSSFSHRYNDGGESNESHHTFLHDHRNKNKTQFASRQPSSSYPNKNTASINTPATVAAKYLSFTTNSTTVAHHYNNNNNNSTNPEYIEYQDGKPVLDNIPDPGVWWNDQCRACWEWCRGMGLYTINDVGRHYIYGQGIQLRSYYWEPLSAYDRTTTDASACFVAETLKMWTPIPRTFKDNIAAARMQIQTLEKTKHPKVMQELRKYLQMPWIATNKIFSEAVGNIIVTMDNLVTLRQEFYNGQNSYYDKVRSAGENAIRTLLCVTLAVKDVVMENMKHRMGYYAKKIAESSSVLHDAEDDLQKRCEELDTELLQIEVEYKKFLQDLGIDIREHAVCNALSLIRQTSVSNYTSSNASPGSSFVDTKKQFATTTTTTTISPTISSTTTLYPTPTTTTTPHHSHTHAHSLGNKIILVRSCIKQMRNAMEIEKTEDGFIQTMKHVAQRQRDDLRMLVERLEREEAILLNPTTFTGSNKISISQPQQQEQRKLSTDTTVASDITNDNVDTTESPAKSSHTSSTTPQRPSSSSPVDLVQNSTSSSNSSMPTTIRNTTAAMQINMRTRRLTETSSPVDRRAYIETIKEQIAKLSRGVKSTVETIKLYQASQASRHDAWIKRLNTLESKCKSYIDQWHTVHHQKLQYALIVDEEVGMSVQQIHDDVNALLSNDSAKVEAKWTDIVQKIVSTWYDTQRSIAHRKKIVTDRLVYYQHQLKVARGMENILFFVEEANNIQTELDEAYHIVSATEQFIQSYEGGLMLWRLMYSQSKRSDPRLTPCM